MLLRPATPPWRTPGHADAGPMSLPSARWRPDRLGSARVRTVEVALAAILAAAVAVGLQALDPLPAVAGAVLGAGVARRAMQERARAAAERLADAVAEA